MKRCKNIDMKNISFKCVAIFLVVITAIVGCNDPITDFGFNGNLSGEIVDQSTGNNLPGDITSGNFVVNALGEEDEVSMVMRVKGDGTFANSALYPQFYEVWVEGPFIESPTERISIDLTGGKEVFQSFEVTPFLNIAPPEINGSPSSSEMMINYNILGNEGHTAQVREVYCSTVGHPTASTGSGPGWHTVTVELSEDQGQETITGLEPSTKYFIRIGARASEASAMNYSEQIIVTTPSN